jgi:hypothetical protein
MPETSGLVTGIAVVQWACSAGPVVTFRSCSGAEVPAEPLAHLLDGLVDLRYASRAQDERVLSLGRPEAYDPKLDVDFTPLRDQDPAAVAFGEAA